MMDLSYYLHITISFQKVNVCEQVCLFGQFIFKHFICFHISPDKLWTMIRSLDLY